MSKEIKLDLKQIIHMLPGRVYCCDLEDNLIFLNELQASRYGKSVNDLIGVNLKDLHSPDVAKVILNVNQDVILEDKQITCIEPDIEEDGTHKKFMSYKAPLKDNDGSIIGTLGFSVDITEEENKKEMTDAALDFILNKIPGHIFWVDAKGVFIGCNDQQALSAGFQSSEELIGKNISEVFSKEEAQALLSANQQIMQSGKTKIIEEPGTYADGEERIYLSHKTPLTAENGEAMGVCGFAIDITTEKELQKQKARNQVVRQVYHDVRSPVTTIRQAMEVFGAGGMDEERYSILMRTAVGQLENILEELRDEARNTAVKTEERVKDEHLVTLVQRIVSNKEFEHRDKPGVKLNFVLDDSAYSAFVHVDRTELERVASNLINNAYEALDGSGEVVVECRCENDQAILCVKDNGPGIPESIIATIGEKNTTTKETGSGLGLYHAKHSVESFGGDLKVEASSEGTAIEVVLPKVKPPKWFGQCVNLAGAKHLVVIDDDELVHSAWDDAKHLNLPESIERHDFYSFADAKTWLDENPAAKTQTVFLCDHEIRGEKQKGLDFILSQEIKDQAYLITSYFIEPEMQERCEGLGVKLMSKALIYMAPVSYEKPEAEEVAEEEDPFRPLTLKELRQRSDESLKAEIWDELTELVQIDDDRGLTDVWKMWCDMFEIKHHCFNNYRKFEEADDANPIDRDMPIFVDMHMPYKNGLVAAKDLYERGFRKIYLASGMPADFIQEEVPACIVAITGKEPNLEK